jgi:hypothetical protein
MATDYAALAKQFGGSAASPPPTDFAALAKQFGGAAVAPAEKPAAPITEEKAKPELRSLSELEGLGEAPVFEEGKTTTKSVMKDFKPPVQPRIERRGAPVTEEMFAAIRNAYDAATPEKRVAMMSRDDWVGSVARTIDEQQKQLDRTKSKQVAALGTTREQRSAALQARGLRPEIAEMEAQRAARIGEIPQPLAEAQETPERVIAAQEAGKEGTLGRATELAKQGIKQGFSGLARFSTELVGDDRAAEFYSDAAKNARQFQEGMGKAKGRPAQILEGAINSIIQQSPGLVAGVLSGGMAAPLVYMGLQSFGQEYAAGRDAGLEANEATARAGAFAAFEILGERIGGLSATIQGIKAAAKGVPTEKLTEYFGKAIVREIPGESLTTLGQAFTDMASGLGKDTTAMDLLNQLQDTVLQTITQGGLMAGGAKGLSAAVRKSRELRGKPVDEPLTAKEILEASAELKRREAEEQQAKPKGEPTIPTADLAAEKVEPAIGTEEQKVEPKTLAQADRQEMINARAEELVALSGFTKSRAIAVATREVDDSIVETASEIATGPVTNRADEIAQELMMGGMPSDQAMAVAWRQAKEEASAEGEQSVKGPVIPAVGESIQVSGRPERTLGTGRTEEAEPSGVVPPGEPVEQPVRGEEAQPAALTEEAVAKTDEFITDKNGEPLVLYRGIQGDKEGAINAEPREGYNVFVSDSPDVAATYGMPDEHHNIPGSIVPIYVKADKLIEFPVTIDRYGFRSFDKIGFDRRARSLAPGEVLVARQVVDIGPMASEAYQVDKEKKYSHYSDVYALGRGTIVESAVGKTKPKKETLSAAETTETKQAEKEGTAEAVEGTKVAEPATEEFVGPPLITQLPSSEEIRKKTGRGRKKLSPDVAEKKAAEKKTVQAEKARADRALLKAQKDLETSALDIEDEALVTALAAKGESREAIEEQRGNLRESAIKQLLRLDANANLRGTAVGKRIKESIKQLGLSPQALDFFRKKIKEEDANREAVRKKEVLASKAESNVGPPEEGLSTAKNAVQAMTFVAKLGDAFEKALAERLRPFLNGVKYVVIEVGDALPPVLEKNREAWDRARGIYVPENRTIYVRGKSFGKDQGVNNTTVLHEALHAATSQKIALGSAASIGGRKDSKLQKLIRELNELAAQSEMYYYYLRDKGQLPIELRRVVESTQTEDGSYEIFNDSNEFLAYGMSDQDFQAFLSALPGKQRSGFSQFVKILLDAFGLGADKQTALSNLIDITDKLLTTPKTPGMRIAEKGLKAFSQRQFGPEPQQIEKKSLKRMLREQKKAEQVVLRSRSGTELAEGMKLSQLARDPGAVREYIEEVWDNMSDAAKTAFVRMPTLDFLTKWAQRDVPRLREVNDLVGEMLGTSQQFMRGAVTLIDEVKRGFKSDKTLRPKLEDFIYETTLAEYDPTNTKLPTRNPLFDRKFEALGDTGKKLYSRILKYYESIINLYSNLLDEQIQNLQGVNPETKTNLMAMIRKTFETENRIRPFFPLVRPDGNYYLRVEKGLYSDQPEFYIFKTRGARNRAAEILAAELNPNSKSPLEEQIDTNNFKLGNNIRDLRRDSLDSSPLLQAIFRAIDEGDFAPVSSGVTEEDQREQAIAAREALKDSIYQLYLTTMPEQSFRRQFIHRKGRIGFSVDLTQNIASVAAKQGIQLARLEFSPKIRVALSAAKDSIAEREELSPFVDETERRANAALAGQEGGLTDAIAGMANKLSFFYYMTGISSALVQPFSLLISGVPVLGANHNNMAKAIKEVSKMLTLVNQYGVVRSNPDGTTSYVAPSLANAKGLKPDERRAVADMVELGVEQSTYSSLVFGYKAVTTDQFDSIPGKGARAANILVGGLLHNVERLTREAVYLASYRMGRDRGLTHEEAVRHAVGDVNEALGNYDVANRPLWMQKGLGKVLFQFKMYPLQMALLLGTNFKRILAPLDAEGRSVAVKKFFGVLSMSALVAGVPGMAFFSSVVGMLGWMWGQMSDDDDWPKELREMDLETYLRTVLIPEYLGDMTIGSVPISDIVDRGVFNALTGWDIASRTQLNDMWGRDSKETKTARDSAIAFMVDNMGPTASMGLSLADAYQAYAEGDYQKMFERMSPAAIRNWIMTNKMMDEGIKTSAGSLLVAKEHIKVGELVGRALGFNPDINAVTQVNNFKLNGVEQKILNKRNLILTRLNVQYKKGTDEGDEVFNKIIEDEVSKFNRQYPSYAITEDTVVKSIEGKLERREGAVAGVTLTEKNVSLVGEAADKLAERLEKRAKEMAEKRK